MQSLYTALKLAFLSDSVWQRLATLISVTKRSLKGQRDNLPRLVSPNECLRLTPSSSNPHGHCAEQRLWTPAGGSVARKMNPLNKRTEPVWLFLQAGKNNIFLSSYTVWGCGNSNASKGREPFKPVLWLYLYLFLDSLQTHSSEKWFCQPSPFRFSAVFPKNLKALESGVFKCDQECCRRIQCA